MKYAGLISIAVAILAFAIFSAVMSYPWPLAVLAGTAIGAFVYSTHATWRRMSRLVRRPENRESRNAER